MGREGGRAGPAGRFGGPAAAIKAVRTGKSAKDVALVDRRGIRIGGRGNRPGRSAGPPGFEARLITVMEAMFAGSTKVERKYPFTIRELALHERVEIDGLAVTPYLMKHFSGAPSYALRIETEGKVLAYSGDTEWVDELIPAARDADLFIAEAYYYDRTVKNHLSLKTLEANLAEINPKRLILTHMSDDMLGRLGTLAHTAASDGMIIEL